MYKIYQMKDSVLKEFGFMSFDFCNKCGVVKKDNYKLVYENDSDKWLSLEDIFKKFNLDIPNDYKGHSLSCSDVVQIDDKFWYCDSIGWKLIENWEEN